MSAEILAGLLERFEQAVDRDAGVFPCSRHWAESWLL